MTVILKIASILAVAGILSACGGGGGGKTQTPPPSTVTVTPTTPGGGGTQPTGPAERPFEAEIAGSEYTFAPHEVQPANMPDGTVVYAPEGDVFGGAFGNDDRILAAYVNQGAGGNYGVWMSDQRYNVGGVSGVASHKVSHTRDDGVAGTTDVFNTTVDFGQQTIAGGRLDATFDDAGNISGTVEGRSINGGFDSSESFFAGGANNGITDILRGVEQ